MNRYTQQMLEQIDQEVQWLFSGSQVQVPEPEGPSDEEWYKILYEEWQTVVSMAEDAGENENAVIYLN